jgi:adenylate kinase family enzyme
MARYIIVTGIPASGKSTTAKMLAKLTNLTFLDKDEILETLFDTLRTGDAEWRSKLSREADRLLQERALSASGAVIVSWWCHPLSTRQSGTPIEWLSKLTGDSIEIYCVCDPAVAATRFQQRRRHEGHLDQNKVFTELVESFREQSQLGPLGIGHLIKVKTDREVDEQNLITEISSLTSR